MQVRILSGLLCLFFTVMTRNIKLLNSQVAELVDARIAQMVTNAVRLVRFQQSLRKYNSYRFESCPDYKNP
jgi:hypothetical protein